MIRFCAKIDRLVSETSHPPSYAAYPPPSDPLWPTSKLVGGGGISRSIMFELYLVREPRNICFTSRVQKVSGLEYMHL